MKNIAFYCSSISWGGLEMNTVRYAKWMTELNYRTILFCVKDSPIHKEAIALELPIVLVEHNKKYGDFKNVFRVKALFKTNNIDIIWFRDTRDMSLLGWVKRLSSRKYFLIYQQAMQLGVSKKDPIHTLRFRAIDLWISTLDFLKKQVLEKTNVRASQIATIPLGVDTSRFNSPTLSKEQARTQLNIPQDAWVVGILGRIDPLKGQHTLINALQISKDHISAIVMGESTKNEGNEYEISLKKKVRSLGLEKRVFFKPYSKDVQIFYRAIDAFVLASAGETFGTVTIEAMSFGLPVIGTNSSGTPEILDHGNAGMLFEPDNAIELADALHTLYHDAATAKEIGEKGKARFLKLYSKEASLQAIDAEIKRRLARH